MKRWLLRLLLVMVLPATLHAMSLTFQGTEDDIANPERGFSVTKIGGSLSASELGRLRIQNHITLVRRVFSLDAFRNGPISPAALASMQDDFDAARQAGVKLVPRFAYNFDQGVADASADQIVEHLDQLKPLLVKNDDVIAFVQAGFIGRWGEWHDSTNDLDNNESRGVILRKILSVLPGDRMVVIRYPEQKREIFATRSNLLASDAFSGSDMSRVGFHNDCFLASDDDEGTFPKGPDTLEGQKAYLARETRYVVMSGETCNLCARAADCNVALGELKRFHFSELNAQYEPHVLKKWEDGGCMPAVRRGLGYRFRLLDVTIPDEISPGLGAHFQIDLTNDGFATPYNSRPVEMVFRSAQSGKVWSCPVPIDPRHWFPGEKQSLQFDITAPEGTAPGNYYVFLRFPDAAESLSHRPEYCIRLANPGIWEAQTGCNWLRCSIAVK